MGATGSTGLTHGTEPDGLRMENHLFLTKLDRSHQLIRSEIEVLVHRTTCGTFLTLVAEKNILARFPFYDIGKISV
jgi:hypothetical protein